MTKSRLYLLLPGLVFIPAPGPVGGWAVTTVEDLPDYVTVGAPAALTFTVRQHGREPLARLTPTVEAVSGKLRTKVSATPKAKAGQYAATLNLPQPGDWTITIHSGFHESKTTLLPIKAVAAGSVAPPALAETERGRRLYVAKGCVTCHSQIPVGPALVGRQFPPDYLKKVLVDPQSLPALQGKPREMPNLQLKQPEITALVAYLNADKVLGAR